MLFCRKNTCFFPVMQRPGLTQAGFRPARSGQAVQSILGHAPNQKTVARHHASCRKFAAMEIPSQYVEQAVEAFHRLPGVGRKTALRLVLHLLEKEDIDVRRFAEALLALKEKVHRCQLCYNVADTETCAICRDPQRRTGQICIVEDLSDVMAIENTQQFGGRYHVLGGLISPMEGIGPGDLSIERLLARIGQEPFEEAIFALSATMEGDTTSFYLGRQLQPHGIRLTTISRGVSVGGELEYVDEVTLGRSIVHRVPYQLRAS
jgi:recombination protein RecR